MQEGAAVLLGQMSLDAGSKKVFAEPPGCLPLLNRLLESHNAVIQEHAA